MYNNMMSLLNKIKEKKNIKKYSIVIVILILVILYMKRLEIYLLLNNVILVASVLALIYVNIIREKFVDKTFIKKFKIKYFVLISIVIVNFIGIISLVESIPNSYLVFLCSIDITLEYCIVGNIFKFKSSYLMSLISSISCICYTVIILIEHFIFKEVYWSIPIITSFIASIILNFGIGLLTLRNAIRSKENFSNENFRQIISYMISITANYIFLIATGLGGIRVAEITLLIRCIFVYKFYNYITSKVLNDSLFKINNNIEKATKIKKELNEVLVKRNRILNEANIMLKKSGDKNNRLIDSIYGGVFLFYSDKLQHINKGTFGTLNMSIDELVGIDLHEFLYKYFNITLLDIRKSKNYIPCIKMNENGLEVEIFLNQIDENSKILYIHDISEINENKKMRKVLEECLEEEDIKREFFSNISHELKTPVNLIFSALQVNEIYIKEGNIELIDRNRKIIKQNCLRLIRTINNFIDANKISEGYVFPDLKPYNIVEIIEGASIAANKYIKLIDNMLIFDSDEEEIYVNCDKEMIIRIILNVLSNSVKYGKNGANINVSVKKFKNSQVIIRVRNYGMPIDKETIPYIFEKFTKINKAFNRLKEGSGLGLFLTKALVELQGGTIKIESTGDGNKFTITFPRTDRPERDNFIHDQWNITPLEEKVDIEFSDIYIE